MGVSLPLLEEEAVYPEQPTGTGLPGKATVPAVLSNRLIPSGASMKVPPQGGQASFQIKENKSCVCEAGQTENWRMGKD